MAELFAYNEKVETIFDLIGDRENDITKSIAWAFVKCPNLLEKVIEHLLLVSVDYHRSKTGVDSSGRVTVKTLFEKGGVRQKSC